MKPNCYPTAFDIAMELGLKKDYDESKFSKAIDLAKVAVELLSGISLRYRQIERTLDLQHGAHILPECPVYDVELVGLLKPPIRVWTEQGVIETQLPFDKYTISYYIGYQERDVPAFIASLVMEVAKAILGENTVELPELLDSVRYIRAQTEIERQRIAFM